MSIVMLCTFLTSCVWWWWCCASKVAGGRRAAKYVPLVQSINVAEYLPLVQSSIGANCAEQQWSRILVVQSSSGGPTLH